MDNTVKILNNKEFVVGEISPYIYGSFVEHMGRVVYSGIYEPDHHFSDEDGFRRDVLEKVREMGVTCVRYPGGNFVSNYDWRDGVGPKETRPRRREIAWKSIETNQFGTDEFIKWANKAGVLPVFAVNLGTKGIENAVSLLEYCNLPSGTVFSNMRKTNGYEEPHHIPIWCLGNEMDGIWQIGHKDAMDYGKLAAQTAHAMKALDSSIQLVVCGSSSSSIDTYIDWERIILEYTYEFVDYIALHQYYGGQEKGTAEFLAQSLDLERNIHTVKCICDTVKHKKRLKKSIDISVDEWGVWEISGEDVAASVENREWEIAPAFSEQIYTMEDALLFASMLMVLVRNCDRVKIACQSLMTNISAAIMTEEKGEVWLQPIFYPFSYMSRYGRGVVLESIVDIPQYKSDVYGNVPCLDTLTIYNAEDREIVYFVVNRSAKDLSFETQLQGFSEISFIEQIVMEHNNLKATNEINHNEVHPKEMKTIIAADSGIKGMINGYSWNMIRVAVKE